MTKDILNRLVFEGIDDKHVVGNLLYNHISTSQPEKRLDQCYEPREKTGVDQLIETIDAELLNSDYTSIGFILDADTNLQNRWKAIKERLKLCCPNIPATPDLKGTIVKDRRDRNIGVWIMPNNGDDGMLEDFLAKMIAKEDNLIPLAKKAVEELPKPWRFSENHLKKAEIHTWLAWQKEPGAQLGGSFKRNYVNPNAPIAVDFVNWVRRLFVF